MTGLIWPYPTRDPSQFRRIDQGWDLQVPVGTPIYAVASGTILYAHNAAGFGDPYPVLELATPIGGNPAVYYGHNHPEVAEGAHVHQGQVIAHALQTPGGNAANLPGWLEIGWWFSGPTGDGQSMHDHLIAAPLLSDLEVDLTPLEHDSLKNIEANIPKIENFEQVLENMLNPIRSEIDAIKAKLQA